MFTVVGPHFSYFSLLTTVDSLRQPKWLPVESS